jgi:RNA polymerase sigma-70 factor (ECF subfamily)
MRIVTNACYDELRRRKRRPAASLEALTVVETGPDAEGEAQLVSEAESPESHAERVELVDAIQHCLDALPDDQRMAVVMCDVQGMNYSEIAASMRTALGTVKSRIARARLKLRDCLQHAQELLPAAYRLGEEQP